MANQSDRSTGAGGRGRPRSRSNADGRGAKTSGGKPRIPRPPKIEKRQERSEVTFERVESQDNRPKQSSKRTASSSSRSAGRRPIDVSEVHFAEVNSASADKLRRRLAEAAAAFEAERYKDAERLLVSIQGLSPGAPEVHELLGLSYYRMGNWAKAIDQLEHFHGITNSVEQHPVLADCNRALRRWGRVQELWDELAHVSPGPELVEEGRIVLAGSMADRGNLNEGIKVLEKAPKPKKKPGLHHLRRWYALADLYERVGDNSRARRLFGDIVQHESDFGDAAERAAALG